MNNNQSNNPSFSSRIGFVLSCAGSAVGLGNIWRFPYLAAKYGGGIFLLVYVVLAVTFGYSLMLTEIAIGRKTGKSVLSAYKSIDKRFGFLGWLAAAVPCIIFPYYCVIGGWVLKYLVAFFTSSTSSVAGTGEYFTSFIGSVGEPSVYFVIYLLLSAIIVSFGVEKGIENVSKVMMPLLVILTVCITIYALTLDGALAGLVYYLKPDFAKFSIKTIVAAMGQLFYSMSLAMGIMVTYGSYMRKSDRIDDSVKQIEIFDTGIALLFGMMIVPAVFAFSGGDETALNAGPSLMFITLPNVFDSMVGGRFVGILFFVLVSLAALTSSISLMETIVYVICERFKTKRVVACIIVTALSFVLGMLSVLGYSMWSDFTLFNMQMLDFFDFISNNVLMPIVALITCILIGYIAGTRFVEDEIELNVELKKKKLYRVMVRYISPICMVVIFLSSVFGFVN